MILLLLGIYYILSEIKKKSIIIYKNTRYGIKKKKRRNQLSNAFEELMTLRKYIFCPDTAY